MASGTNGTDPPNKTRDTGGPQMSTVSNNINLVKYILEFNLSDALGR